MKRVEGECGECTGEVDREAGRRMGLSSSQKRDEGRNNWGEGLQVRTTQSPLTFLLPFRTTPHRYFGGSACRADGANAQRLLNRSPRVASHRARATGQCGRCSSA